ncbi:prepilin peptidase [Phosphitispora fastidiosa]|uniref:prepilin peptidase n=1 Tax=Phosphitispora fastidiosa TaxID=2837202 RepID=UPI001E3874FD|nr:A24 family peptidase [Phosphitispora fastidiosa]MBU7008771.1 leader peptidase (prepilin peptidase)/N-methyltransferase [Phosphitispora fastidiosa]
MNIIIFLLGLIIGSFINVVICRLPRGESVVWPPSHCTLCKKRIKWQHLIPVLSYIYLKGKCAYCNHKISIRYPIIELIFGISFYTLFLMYGPTWHFLSVTIFLIIIFLAAVIDIEHRIIPNKLNIFGAVSGFVLAAGGHQGWRYSLEGFLAGGVVLFAAAMASRGGMGGGDIKYAAAMGTFLGWQGILATVFLASVMGSLFGIILCIIKRKPLRKTGIPFGPFLSTGAFFIYFFQTELLELYLDLIMH